MLDLYAVVEPYDVGLVTARFGCSVEIAKLFGDGIDSGDFAVLAMNFKVGQKIENASELIMLVKNLKHVKNTFRATIVGNVI